MGKYIAIWCGDDGYALGGRLSVFSCSSDREARNQFWEQGRTENVANAMMFTMPAFMTGLGATVDAMAGFENRHQWPRVFDCSVCCEEVNLDVGVPVSQEEAWAGTCGSCLERQESKLPPEVLKEMAEMDEMLEHLVDAFGLQQDGDGHLMVESPIIVGGVYDE